MERRGSSRKRTLFGGKIIFNSGRSAIDCTVRNVSEEGAALQVDSPVGIPDKFYLVIADTKDPRECTVAWRTADRIGVSFEHAGTDAARPDPHR